MADDILLVVIDSLIWVIWSMVVGYSVNKISDARLLEIKLLPLSLKTASRIQKLTKVKKWKDWVPEAGALFKNGTSKRNLASHSIQSLESLRIETIRAELAHMIFPLIVVIFFVFNPWYLNVAMCIFAFFANVPFILIQRYNRSRIEAVISRHRAK